MKRVRSTSSTASSSSSGIEIGAVVLQRYVIERVIGRGGMGRVYAATDTEAQPGAPTMVAVKVLRRERLEDRRAVARFSREMRVGKVLESPHAVRVLATGKHAGVPLMVMELLTGRSLGSILGRRLLSGAEVVAVGRGLADVLADAHRRAIVHRDIKPDNVFIAESAGGYVVKLLDFGISRGARADDEPVTKPGYVVGTVPFMSPEQASALGAVPASDVWGLGATLFFALTGRTPFATESLSMLRKQASHGPPPSLGAFREDLPQALVRLVDGCLEREPSRRLTPSALVAGLASLAGELPAATWDDVARPDEEEEEPAPLSEVAPGRLDLPLELPLEPDELQPLVPLSAPAEPRRWTTWLVGLLLLLVVGVALALLGYQALTD